MLDAFATCPPAGELAGALHRETFWLISDHLGTPRMVADRTGSLAGVKRHDYLPFGEELSAGSGGRTAAQGYSAVDNVRQKFTQKERDPETNLDYFLARYYSSAQGRFTSPDEFTGGPDELYYFVDEASANPTFYADLGDPQSLNKYQYTYNNPLRYVDPDGHDPCCETETQSRVAAGAAAGAAVGAVAGAIAGGVSGGAGGGAVGTMVAPGPGTVVGVIAGGGGGGAAGATKGAAAGAVIGGLVGLVYDYVVGPSSPPAAQPAQPQTTTPPQQQVQPLPPPAPVQNRRGRGGKRNVRQTEFEGKSEAQLQEQLKTATRQQKKKIIEELKGRTERNKQKRKSRGY